MLPMPSVDPNVGTGDMMKISSRNNEANTSSPRLSKSHRVSRWLPLKTTRSEAKQNLT